MVFVVFKVCWFIVLGLRNEMLYEDCWVEFLVLFCEEGYSNDVILDLWLLGWKVLCVVGYFVVVFI